jgi:hypothetical protein
VVEVVEGSEVVEAVAPSTVAIQEALLLVFTAAARAESRSWAAFTRSFDRGTTGAG